MMGSSKTMPLTSVKTLLVKYILMGCLSYAVILAMTHDTDPQILAQRNITLYGSVGDIFRLVQDMDSHRTWCQQVQDYESDDHRPIGVGKIYLHTTVYPLVGTVQREMTIVEMGAPYILSYIQDTWLYPRVDIMIIPQQDNTVIFKWTMTTRWDNNLFKNTVLPVLRFFNTMTLNQSLMKLSALADNMAHKRKQQNANIETIHLDSHSI